MEPSAPRRRHHVLVRLLGAYGVQVDGRPVPATAWDARRAVELVELLALEPGHQLHRERVIDALWPHLPPHAGAANLHKAAHLARRSVHEVDAVVLRGGQVSLWPHADLATDVEAFEAAATRALQVGDPAACRSAAALYGGELLPAARYEDWAAVPRQRLQRLLLELLRLAGLWEQVLALDPSDEAACRALMRHHRDEGQRAAAARAFQRLRQALRAELGLDPSPQTAALYAEIVGMTAPGKVRGRSAP